MNPSGDKPWINHGHAMPRLTLSVPQDDRLLVIVGPCSIHDPKAARDYAHRLQVTTVVTVVVTGGD